MMILVAWACILQSIWAGEAQQPLEYLQWGIKNSGATQKFEYTDSYFVDLPACAGEDIHALTEEIPLNQRIRVAVLDTGIDVDHPNLAGRFRIAGMVDAQTVQDRLGHGTHVAGIIAAVANGTGIRGVSQNVEILPIQVMKGAPNSPLRPRGEEDLPTAQAPRVDSDSFVDAILRGMTQAIQERAQVVNLSLSWPAAVDSPVLRTLFQKAQQQGMLIVASAGNDSSDARLFPCQYDEVICVASHNPDGSLSHFSNYGSFVDLAAPGINIVSTWPTRLRAHHFTEKEGYEYKNGTSMAAPFVAGALAQLLATGSSPEEVYARLLIGTRITHLDAKRKWIRTGNLDIQRALLALPQPVIIPAHKEAIRLDWNRQANDIAFSFELKNIWSLGTDLRVHVRVLASDLDGATALSSELSLSIDQWQIKTWGAQEVQKFRTNFLVSRKNFDSRQILELEILNSAGALLHKSIRIPIEISVPISKITEQAEEFLLQGDELVFSEESKMRSITSLDAQARQDYLWISKNSAQDSSKNLKTVALQVLEQIDHHYEASQVLNVELFDGELLAIQRIHWRENQPTYVLISRKTVEKRRTYRFQFLGLENHALKILRQMDYENKNSNFSGDFQWLKIKTAQGSELVPAWLVVGMLPESEVSPPSPWPQDLEYPKMHLYYLLSDGLHTVKLDTQSTWVKLVPQSPAEAELGSVKAIVSQGKDYILKYFNVSLNGSSLLSVRDSIVLAKYRKLSDLDGILPLVSLASGGVSSDAILFSGPSVRGQLRSTWIRHAEVIADELHKPGSIFDSTIQLLAGFAWDDSTSHRSAFSETLYELQYQDFSTGEVAAVGLNRFTFLPGFLLNSTRFPLVVSQAQGEQLPALLVAGSRGDLDSSEIIVPQYDSVGHLIGLGRPAPLQIHSDAVCNRLDDPISANNQNSAQISFFCGDRFFRVAM